MTIICRLLVGIILSVTTLNSALAAIEPDYSSEKTRSTMPWFADVTQESKEADLMFIKDMRPHHAGALTMSQEYLQSSSATNDSFRRFTKGIIHNQEFEIMVLDTIESHVEKVNVSKNDEIRAQVATKGLAQRDKFKRAPLPILIGKIGAEEVRFSKAMIIHHQGAVDMCQAYNADPAVTNGYLKQFCFDIIRDQTNEIKYMNAAIAMYDGNPDDIKIDPSMIHGMDGMMGHGGHHKMDHSKHH